MESLKPESSILLLTIADGEEFNSKANIFVYDLALH